ncbi:MAG TPA: response regulator [Acidimicrobiales bacterium]
MADVLVVSDSAKVRAEVISALFDPTTSVRELTRGKEVRDSVAAQAPDLVVIDQQVGKMGGMATCMDLRLEESGGRSDHVPVLLLLDRRADVFLARRAGADGWVVKPLDSIRLARAMQTLLDGGIYHDEAYRPLTVSPVPSRTADPVG